MSAPPRCMTSASRPSSSLPLQVAVVGAGVVGTAVALELRRRGAQVTLIDRDAPGSGCSAGNSGALSPGSVAPLALPGVLAGTWSLATALSLLAWFVFAPQCLSTVVVLRRETGGWRLPWIVVLGYFGLAWVAACATYQLTAFITGVP